jgi:hypothetical protein
MLKSEVELKWQSLLYQHQQLHFFKKSKKWNVVLIQQYRRLQIFKKGGTNLELHREHFT